MRAALLGIGAAAGAVLLFGTQSLCPQVPLGFSVWKDGASTGYTLIAPYRGENFFDGPGSIRLIDEDGFSVHEWETVHPVLAAYLQPNGHVFAGMTPSINHLDYPSGGTMGVIQELDWNGSVVWEHVDNMMTHDFDVMPDGKVVYLRWSHASPKFARGVRGGLASATTSVWLNDIVVVNRDHEIEWTWRTEEHLDPRDFQINPLVGRFDWAHMNSVRYLADNPFTHTPAFLVSARNISTVFIIDRESKRVLWRSPRDLFSLQHDATMTEKDTILVFDNGLMRPNPVAYLASRVVEVDPKTDEVVWEYVGGKTKLEQIQFGSSIMSGSQRLANGNTLITASMLNTIFEVTQGGRIVWKYTNDFRDDDSMQAMYKARKYDPAGTEWSSWVRRSFHVCNAGSV